MCIYSKLQLNKVRKGRNLTVYDCRMTGSSLTSCDCVCVCVERELLQETHTIVALNLHSQPFEVTVTTPLSPQSSLSLPKRLARNGELEAPWGLMPGYCPLSSGWLERSGQYWDLTSTPRETSVCQETENGQVESQTPSSSAHELGNGRAYSLELLYSQCPAQGLAPSTHSLKTERRTIAG